jgi:hypothetical protein
MDSGTLFSFQLEVAKDLLGRGEKTESDRPLVFSTDKVVRKEEKTQRKQ